MTTNRTDGTGLFQQLDAIILDADGAMLPRLALALSARSGSVAARLLTAGSEDGNKAIPDENLSVDEAARRLGMSRDWLYHNAKRLPFKVRIGRKLLFSASGLERWNRQRQAK